MKFIIECVVDYGDGNLCKPLGTNWEYVINLTTLSGVVNRINHMIFDKRVVEIEIYDASIRRDNFYTGLLKTVKRNKLGVFA